jgi:hypothetical protein
MKITQEAMGWGVRLHAQPFDSPKYAELEISAEIVKPKAGKNSEIRVMIPGVPVSSPLRIADVLTLIEALKAVRDEAGEIAARFNRREPVRKI